MSTVATGLRWDSKTPNWKPKFDFRNTNITELRMPIGSQTGATDSPQNFDSAMMKLIAVSIGLLLLIGGGDSATQEQRTNPKSRIRSQRTTIDDAAVRNGRVISIVDYGAIPDAPVSTHRDEFDSYPEGSPQKQHLRIKNHLESTSHIVEVAVNNTRAFNAALEHAQDLDTILVPDGKVFSVIGGILLQDKQNMVLDIAGSLRFLPFRSVWPFDTVRPSSFGKSGRYDPGIAVVNCTNVTLTSTSKTRAQVDVDYNKNQVHMVDKENYFGGIINGNGKMWWDNVLTGKIKDHRPRLLHVMESSHMLLEHLTFLNSPFWTVTYECVDSEVRYINVLVDRRYENVQAMRNATDSDSSLESDFLPHPTTRPMPNKIPLPIADLPDWIFRKFRQPQDLNTDGIDPLGANIWIHDCIVQNADDSIAVKPSHGGRDAAFRSPIPDCTRNITIENMVLTGFGASVGSVPPHEHHSCIDQVLFRNISMPGTGKGIYVKSDWGDDCRHGMSGQITNIVYRDVRMWKPFWWAIWIGPQQQHQPHSSLQQKCALLWPLEARCPVADCVRIDGIRLENIHISQPLISPAVLMGNASNPLTDIQFMNVTVHDSAVQSSDVIVSSSKKFWHGKWPFHERKYPWRGRMKCEHAHGTVDATSRPKPGCLQPIPAEALS